MPHETSAQNTIPTLEELHLAKLKHYEILGTPAETTFDIIAQLAANAFNAPYAGICFQEGDKVFSKSAIGSNEAIILPLQNHLTIITDTATQENSSIAFFVSAPIKTPDGHSLGVIYASDTAPQVPTNRQLNMLKMLAALVMEKLESRIAVKRTFRAYDDRLHVLIHDLKNPMTTISLQSELMGRIPAIDEKAIVIAGKINAQSKRMVDSLNDILSSAKKEATAYKPQKAKVDLKEVLEAIKLNLNLALKSKNQSILIDIEEPLAVFGDPDKLNMVFSLLIENAIKFSPLGKEINITHQTTDHELIIAIKDNGVGLTPEDLEKIFLKFAVLSAVPTNGESTNGLGLITARAFVDMHKGKLWAESAGKDLGTTFYVSLPLR